jgi:hypothetical protein
MSNELSSNQTDNKNNVENKNINLVNKENKNDEDDDCIIVRPQKPNYIITVEEEKKNDVQIPLVQKKDENSGNYYLLNFTSRIFIKFFLFN